MSPEATEAGQESVTQLQQMLDKYRTREYGKAMFAADFAKLVKLIASASPECQVDGQPDSTKAALLLIYDVLISKEKARRKRDYA